MYHYALVIYCGDNLVNKKKKNMFGTCETRSVLYIRWHLLTTGLIQSWSPSSDGGQMRGNITCQWEMKRLRVRYETEFINSGVSYIGAWCQHTSLLVFSFTTQWIFAVSLPLFMSFFPIRCICSSVSIFRIAQVPGDPALFPLSFATSPPFTPISAECHKPCSSASGWFIVSRANMCICCSCAVKTNFKKSSASLTVGVFRRPRRHRLMSVFDV